MAVILAMTYMKKLGLPNYSSHSCSASLTVEISDVGAAAQESTKLYQLLQASVDQEIQTVGYMPDATVYGMNKEQPVNGSNGNGHHPPAARNGSNDHWNCTDGQKGLILRVINENKLDKNDVEKMAQDLFGVGVKQIDKMQASQLIEELLEKNGKRQKPRWNNRQPARA